MNSPGQSKHQHEWQPNGTVNVDQMSCSPCSTLDDQFWTDVISVQVCSCGAVRKVKVGEKNFRRRGDMLRRRRARSR